MEPRKTKLKFVKSERTGSWVGFVTINPKNGCIKGVREDSKEPKKVCVVNHDIASTIEAGVLYNVEMVPMKNPKGGFVVVAVEPYEFEAVIKTDYVKNAVYRVSVKFGNKTIIYDPMDGRKDSVKTIEGVAAILEARKDIKDLTNVIYSFRRSANILLTTFEEDGHYVTKNK